MNDAIFLTIGVGIWWRYFGLECLLNGTMVQGGPYRLGMPFLCWLEEFSWNLPFVGWKFRMEFAAGDVEHAKQLPGRWHFSIVCVLLPLTPWIIYRALS